MAQRDNLIATYQSNPTLQSRYTQQQYLDLFGFGANQPQPDPDPTPTDPNPPVQNIIGQNLNQDRGEVEVYKSYNKHLQEHNQELLSLILI